MSLGIAFKGPEGIVLAADSRVTLTAELQQGEQKMLLPSMFDNATKLLQITCQPFVGVVTYGLGAIGQVQQRTAHSFLPEFEDELKDCIRLSVKDFAGMLSAFFLKQWKTTMPEQWSGPEMTFLIGGYDDGAPYGRVFQVGIPLHPDPLEWNAEPGQFGITWGGQLDYTNRLIKGYDPNLPSIVQKTLDLTDEQKQKLEHQLEGMLSAHIPYQFLPLQDCVDLSVFLIRTTIELQTWIVGVRGVGGAIDVATITRTEGFKPVQVKTIVGHGRRV